MTTAPVLVTERLRLRMPVLADFEHRAAFYASDRSRWEGGPFDRRTAWRIWASEVGQWPLMGYGPFSVVALEDGRYMGEVGLYHPAGYPEPDLGWFVVPEAEGRGIAHEAARRIAAWAGEALGLDHLMSYIAPGNARSIALARRLGARLVDAATPDPGDLAFRHALSPALRPVA